MADVIHGIVCIFHHIVQQGRRNGLVSKTYIIDDNLGHSYRVQYIRLS